MKKYLALVLALATVFSLAACKGKAKPETEVETITIGISNAIPKIEYTDENGAWHGYDYDILAKADELLTQYEFKYEIISDFAAAFTGLDTKKFDLLAVHSGWTEERAEKYLYGQESFYDNAGYVLNVKKGSTIVINSEEDLGGLKIAVPPGISHASFVEAFNEAHPDNPIIIDWNTGTAEQQLADLTSGAVDGIFGTTINNQSLKEAYGDVFDEAGEFIFYEKDKNNGTYFLYNYGNEAFRDEIDAIIKQLRDDGTLSKSSIEYFGVDVTLKP